MKSVFHMALAAALSAVVWSSSAAQAASVETSCIGYGRAVTDHLRPNAPKGSPEYRAVYFPTYEECMRRGGSRFMPGGLAAAPWYLSRPPTPPSNPYTPTQPGTPTPPAPPPGNPYTPTPPAPPPAAGPTPQQIVAQGRSRIEQSMPGGMSYPAAVRTGLEGCGNYGIRHGNAQGPDGSAKWQEHASSAVNWCIQLGGEIGGQLTNSPHISLALRMIKYRTAPASKFPRHAAIAGNHACAAVAGEPDYLGCVTEQGQWLVCYKTACHVAEPALFPAGASSQAAAVFHNCPGAQCGLGPSGRPLASGRKLNDVASDLIQLCNNEAYAAAQAAGPAGSPAWNQAGQSRALQCLAGTQPPILRIAASRKAGVSKGRECGVGADGQTYCVDEDGVVCVVQRDGSCGRIEESITVTPPPPPGISRGTTYFYNCPNNSCAIPAVDDPRRSVSPPPIVGQPGFDSREVFRNCRNFAISDEQERQCFIEKCKFFFQDPTGLTTEAKCSRLYEQERENARRRLLDSLNEVGLKIIPVRPDPFWETLPGRWLVFIAGTGAVGLGVAALVVAGPGIIVAGAAATGTAVLIGVVAGSAGGEIVGKSYGAIGDQACRPHVAQVISRASPPAELGPSGLKSVEDFLTELCALNLPDIAQIRAMQRGSYQACEQQSRYAQPVNGAPQIVAISRQLNNCLRSQSVQAAEKALLPRQAGLRFADQWSDLLRSCAASSGMQWHGDLENGAAWPAGYSTGGDALLPISACMQSSIK